ncbi:MAG TPA: ATPase, T2SS/T4P/T4SS family, partial [Candidatus Baltobacteraceae bacterium]|nr:ATPase, T2SS/T4P/T4SS family [Candidatus Baltobacteraceae bacterium]
LQLVELVEDARSRYPGLSDMHLDPGVAPTYIVDNRQLWDQHAAPIDIDLLGRMVRQPGTLSEFARRRLEDDRECDLGYQLHDGSRCRVHVMMMGEGAYAATIRILPSRVLAFEKTGLPRELLELLDAPQGLIIFSGPVGSGKTTALHSMLDDRNIRGPACHIYTIEDPIEYIHREEDRRFALFHQRELGTSARSYPIAISGSLRIRPNILVIGEARDLDTMEALLIASQVGRLAMTTTHSHDTYQTIKRITSMFGERYDEALENLKSVLLAIVNLRLVPMKHGGVVTACEIMRMTPAIRNLIDKPLQIHGELSKEPGCRTLEDDLVRLYREGAIDRESAIAYANSNRLDYIKGKLG